MSFLAETFALPRSVAVEFGFGGIHLSVDHIDIDVTPAPPARVSADRICEADLEHR
jgi:hypothetical protein